MAARPLPLGEDKIVMRKASPLQYQVLDMLNALGGTADRGTLGRRINATKMRGLTDNTWLSVVKRGWIACEGGPYYDYDAVLSLTEDGRKALAAGPAAAPGPRLTDKRARVLNLITLDCIEHRTTSTGRKVWEAAGRREVTDVVRWLDHHKLVGTVGGKTSATVAGLAALAKWKDAQQRAKLVRAVKAAAR